MKSQKGITLIALVITVIVLIILAGVTIGASTGSKQNVKDTKTELFKSELEQVHQAILENYIKYEQLKNEDYLVGTEIEYSEAQSEIQEITNIDESITLKATEDDTESNEKKYYKLDSEDLKTLGISNATEDNGYIVNYYTGEVFNYKTKTTSSGEALYICK